MVYLINEIIPGAIVTSDITVLLWSAFAMTV